MGLQYRKRTRGKKGWLNFSYSDRNGVGASASVKAGNITHNFGGKRASRTTVNLGNGVKYVSYGSSRPKTTSKASGLLALAVIIWALVALISIGGWFIKIFALGVIAGLVYLIHKSR